jgi:hypothetical protein
MFPPLEPDKGERAMTKRIGWSLVVALLVASAAFAAETSLPSQEIFLASLQAPATEAAPAEPNLDKGLEPLPMALPSCTAACPCTYQCKKCTATSVKLCAVNCNGANGCASCQSGTVCSF